MKLVFRTFALCATVALAAGCPKPAPVCGDGIVDTGGGESCDDANAVGADGCSSACLVEAGFDCTGQPSVCTPIGGTCGDGTCEGAETCTTCEDDCGPCVPPGCGDGTVDAANGEECDDGAANGAGADCTPTCTVNVCGDGFAHATNEECDDGNTTDGDGCSSACLTEPAACGDGTCDLAGTETCANCAADCALDPACAGTVCGDDVADPGEACDGIDLATEDCASLGFDGGVLACDAACAFDTSGCFTCGDGILNGGEVCDTTDLGGTSCSDLGFIGGALACDAACAFDTSGCSSCGDGMIDAGESCDGGNLGGATCMTQGFGGGTLGCTAGCAYDVTLCNNCGNGVIDPGEGCEDGNTTSGDGCSFNCTVESGYLCNGTPSACFPTPQAAGDLVITELQKNPTAVSDATGEWFEVHNPTGNTFDLQFMTFQDLSATNFTVTTTLLIGPGGYLVFGNNADAGTNGGVGVDYAYSGMALNNTGTESLTALQGGTTIDTVVYDDVSFPTAAGHALSLDPSLTTTVDNDFASSWCNAYVLYNASDFGTPGNANPTCVLTFTSVPGLDIPDNDVAGVDDALNIPTSCTVTDITVDVNISHTYVGALSVELTSPLGTVVTLHAYPGASGTSILGTYDTTLAVDGPGTLALYNGENALGLWTLNVADHDGFDDDGTLNSWGLHVTCALPAAGITSGLSIPDNNATGISSTMAMGTTCTVANVTVDVNATHTYVGDLEVDLVHVASGTSVRLLNRPGATAGTTTGTNDDNLSALNTYSFSETGVIFPGAVAGIDVASGTYLPMGPGAFSAFDGLAAAGLWTLTVRDRAAADVGTLNNWTLHVECALPGVTSTPGPLPFAVPDNQPAGVVDTIATAPSCTIGTVTVDVTFAPAHTYAGDVVMELTNLSTGTVVRLLDQPGGGGNGDNLAGPYTFEDGALAFPATPVGGAIPANSYSPEGPGLLSDFTGEASGGLWELFVSDNAAVDVGSVSSWSVNFDCL